MKLICKAILAAFTATALIPAAAMAVESSPDRGYLVDSSGTVVKNSSALCWHNVNWSTASPQEPCTPNIQTAAVIAPTTIAAAAPAARQQKISLSGDALFAFDKSVLKPEGKKMLDDLVSKLDGATSYDTITVTGHTDRFGSTKYNQKLSERRAATVRDYLISENVQAGRISVEGKGEMQPVTKADECRGAKSTKVVACLQPDRRVDIEITGTKTVTGSL